MSFSVPSSPHKTLLDSRIGNQRIFFFHNQEKKVYLESATVNEREKRVGMGCWKIDRCIMYKHPKSKPLSHDCVQAVLSDEYIHITF